MWEIGQAQLTNCQPGYWKLVETTKSTGSKVSVEWAWWDAHDSVCLPDKALVVERGISEFSSVILEDTRRCNTRLALLPELHKGAWWVVGFKEALVECKTSRIPQRSRMLIEFRNQGRSCGLCCWALRIMLLPAWCTYWDHNWQFPVPKPWSWSCCLCTITWKLLCVQC